MASYQGPRGATESICRGNEVFLYGINLRRNLDHNKYDDPIRLAYNQDEERLQRCDIHYLTPDLRIIPFCSFNVIPEWYRDRIQQKFGMPIEQWEAQNHKKLEDGLYRGTLRRGTHHAGCGCALGENGEEVHIQPITGT